MIRYLVCLLAAAVKSKSRPVGCEFLSNAQLVVNKNSHLTRWGTRWVGLASLPAGRSSW